MISRLKKYGTEWKGILEEEPSRKFDGTLLNRRYVGEPFSEYKIRQKVQNSELKSYLKGELIYTSKVLLLDREGRPQMALPIHRYMDEDGESL